MITNSINPSFGSTLTVHNVYYKNDNSIPKLIYSRHKRNVNTPENMKLTKDIMKALCYNLKLPVDTPVAAKMHDIVDDLYYEKQKRIRPYYTSDSLREINLLTGPEINRIDSLYPRDSKLTKSQKENELNNMLREMFNRSSNSKGIFKGFIDIYASPRDLIEPAEGKDSFNLIAIDDIAKALE